MPEKNRATRAALLAGLIGSLALGLISIHVPFGRDQGVAAYLAEAMAHGDALYRDVYHFNLPGIFFVYRLARLVPLPWTEAVNLTHLVFLALTYLAVYRAGRKILPAGPAVLAALFWAAFAVVVYTDYWDIAQKESLAALPLALALLYLLRLTPQADADQTGAREPILLNAIMFGVMCGLAAQFKPTLGIVLPALIAPVWKKRGENKAAGLLVGAGLLGFGLALVPLLIYLVATGSFGAMLEAVVRFGGFYGGQTYEGVLASIEKTALNLAGWLYDWRFLVALSVIGLVETWRRDRGARVIALFGGLLLFQVILQMKYFTYHWIPLLIPLSLLAAAGAGGLLAGTGRGEAPALRRWALIVILAAFFLGNLGPSAKRYRRELYYDFGKLPHNNFLAAYGRWGGGDLCPLAAQAVADYLKEHSRPTDPILVFGLEPGLYVLADRYPPTRFAYDQPLVTDPRGNAAFAKYREAMRAEFLRDLAARPPRYVVVIENDQTGIEAADSYTQMKSFDAFHDLIEKDYVLETKIENYFLFRRISAAEENR